MQPALLPGDRLLVDPAAFRCDLPSPGEIVVVRDPERTGRTLVKRVAAVAGERGPTGEAVPDGSVFLLGDDLERSRDSRAFGPVARTALLGKAWHRYLPPERRGPLGPADVAGTSGHR